MKIAVVQLKAKSKREQNFQKAVELIVEAAGEKAELIALPEMFLCQKPCKKSGGTDLTPIRERERLKTLAKKFCVYLLAGSIYEKEKRVRTNARASHYNTSYLIDPHGKVIGKYRKIHLFDASVEGKKIRESEKFLPGKKGVMVKVKNFSVGLSICYDLRFPLLYQKYSQKGAELLCIPSGFTYETGAKHWESLLRARAIENFCYVLAPNLCGRNHHGVRLFGNSMIISPSGKILARASSSKEEIIYADIQKEQIKAIRKIFFGHH